MAVDPDSLPITDPPMAWSPNIVSVSCVVAGTVDVIRPIINSNADRTWITATVVRRWTGIWPISRVACVVAFTSAKDERGGDRDEQKTRFHFHRLHIRIGVTIYVSVPNETLLLSLS